VEAVLAVTVRPELPEQRTQEEAVAAKVIMVVILALVVQES
jgi:hypothetical protein